MTGTVAYQGVPGALGEEACRTFLPNHERVAKPSFYAVIEAVRMGETDLGMLPLTNSTVGPVPGVRVLIQTSGLDLRARHELPVRLHLMARPGVALEEVCTVVSHPVALAQCARSIARLRLDPEEAANTAMAAQALAGDAGRTRAALASEVAAEVYGLTILSRDMHDRPDNATTFAVVARPEGNPQ